MLSHPQCFLKTPHDVEAMEHQLVLSDLRDHLLKAIAHSSALSVRVAELDCCVAHVCAHAQARH